MKPNIFASFFTSSLLSVFIFGLTLKSIVGHLDANHSVVNSTAADLISLESNEKWVNENLEKIEKNILHDEWKSEEKPENVDKNQGNQGVHWYNNQVVHELKRDPNGGRQQSGQKKQQWKHFNGNSNSQNEWSGPQNNHYYDSWLNNKQKQGYSALQHPRNPNTEYECDDWNIQKGKEGDDWSNNPWNNENTNDWNDEGSDRWNPRNKMTCEDNQDNHRNWGSRSRPQNNYGNSNEWDRFGKEDFDGNHDSGRGYNEDRVYYREHGNKNNGWTKNKINAWERNDIKKPTNGENRWKYQNRDQNCQNEPITDEWSKSTGWRDEQQVPEGWSTIEKRIGGVNHKGSSTSQQTHHKQFSKTKWFAGELGGLKKQHWK